MYRISVSILFIAVLSASIGGAIELTIENPHLKAGFDLSKNQLKLSSGEVDQADLNATFPVRIKSANVASIHDRVWGKGSEILLQGEADRLISLRLFPGLPFLLVHTTIDNSGPDAFVTPSLDILDLNVSIGNQKLISYGSGGLKNPEETEGSYSFHALVNGETRNGLVTGGLTHHRGVSIFKPGENSLHVQIDFGRYQVDPGESRETDTIAFGFFEDSRLGLEAWADAVAKLEKIELAPKPEVYCTWYHKFASDEQTLRENTEFAAEKLKPFGLNVMQIDDRWQSILPEGFKHEGDEIPTTGPIKVFVDTEENYSRGMDHTAAMIDSHGMVPGIWFMPFAGNYQNPYFDHEVFAKAPDGTPYHDSRWSGTCVDSTSPKGEKFIFDRTKRIYDWGYRYFKIDGLHTGMPSKNIYINTDYKDQNFGDSILHDPKVSHIEAYRKGLQILRKAAPDAFVLGCNVSQNMMCMGPAIGLMEAMRIGPDNGNGAKGDWRQVTLGAWHGTNLYFLNGRVWHNDPDPIYVRESNPLKMARWMCSWLAVSGGMHSSSEQYGELPEERLDLLRVCLPNHTLPARPVDLLETNQPRIWLVQNDRVNIVGLFNWQEKEPAEIEYDLDKLGLDSNSDWVGFDFWGDRFIKPFSGKLKQEIPAADCRVLAVRPQKDHPQLLSTSRHITQGLMDVVEENWDSDSKWLTGKSEVVANHPYELRIALPAKGEWQPKELIVSEGRMEVTGRSEAGIRVLIESSKSGEITWEIGF